MPKFARSFAIDHLAEWDANSANNAVRTLFRRWCLPGEKPTEGTRLRLGLRHGYLNFYIKGQSVAKLSCGPRGPKLLVHKAYVNGRRRGEGHRDGKLKGYQDYDANALADPFTGSFTAGWVETAETYASAEKRFVDDLIAANAGVIDLEMGLPASNLPGRDHVAPRMDLVIAQQAGSEPLSIGFWEAKCAVNSELRANGKPGVLEQVERYQRWMADDDRIAQVQQAYRNTATALLALYHLFRAEEGRNPECVGIWHALTELESPRVTVRPGVVIGNYWPEGCTESIASGRMAQCVASFARNGHGEKLQRAGIRVHEVGPDYGRPTLPFLPAAMVPA